MYFCLQKRILYSYGHNLTFRFTLFYLLLYVDKPSRHHAGVLTMTHGMTDRERQSVVSRATLVAFITIMVFTFTGQFLFKFFGISTNGFRIAGGVIIFKIGFDMLQARYTPMKLKDEEIKTYADDISITPLGIPMLCGPGAIANAIVLMQDAHTIQMKGVLIGMIAFIYLITFFILRASTRLVKILGETGNNVMMRLMGLILMVIAVECLSAE